jgi:hypothetical protein
MIESCKESWLLFFEDNISKFYNRYPCKLAYVDYIKFCKDETYMPFINTKFGLKLKSLVDANKTSKNNKTVRYYLIIDDIKARYDISNKECMRTESESDKKLDDIDCIYCFSS